ncbi:MAG: hypothetical protein MJZ96_07460 [Paludibacteraceae bacterium]|nr:hypothetical protein [Paludibacteraceae bacterium]
MRRTVLKQKSSRTLGSGDSVAEKFGSQTDAAISRRKSLVAVSLARPHTTKYHADKPSNPFASQNLQIAARIVRFPKNIFVWETA